MKKAIRFPDPRNPITAGHSKILPTHEYRWEGLERGADPARPAWLFQITLSGWGIFHSRKGKWKVDPGKAFCAVLPSQHSYYKDPKCPEWEFLWIIVHHPYAVGRLTAFPALVNTILAVSEESGLFRGARQLVETMQGASDLDAYLDPFQLEADLLGWMVEIERSVFLEKHPQAPRQQLLASCRDYVVKHLERPVKTSEIARLHGMSRSNFGHYFLKVAGIAPAAFIHGVRLDEAAKLLCDPRWSVKEVAAMTGFFDASHFCKSFRQRFQASPAVFRSLKTVSTEREES